MRGATVRTVAIPCGFEHHAQVGQAIGWGRGDDQAVSRIGTLTLADLQGANFTAEIARQWWQGYAEIARLNPKNPSALGRAQLMKHAYELLRAAEVQRAGLAA